MLVFEPVDEGTGDNGSNHEVTLYFRPLAGRDTTQFYADARYGEFWVGPRPTLKEFSERYGVRTKDLSELEVAITKNAGAQALGGCVFDWCVKLILPLMRWLILPGITRALRWRNPISSIPS